MFFKSNFIFFKSNFIFFKSNFIFFNSYFIFFNLYFIFFKLGLKRCSGRMEDGWECLFHPFHGDCIWYQKNIVYSKVLMAGSSITSAEQHLYFQIIGTKTCLSFSFICICKDISWRSCHWTMLVPGRGKCLLVINFHNRDNLYMLLFSWDEFIFPIWNMYTKKFCTTDLTNVMSWLYAIERCYECFCNLFWYF